VLQRAGLRGDDPEHDRLALGEKAQRLQPARAIAVPFEKVTVDVDPVEQEISNPLVAARGNERRTEIAAAHMRGDDQVTRASVEGGIDDARIDVALLVRVVAAARQHLPLSRIAQIRKAAIIEL